ncbi:MAG: secretin N-terminal domain-containing protein [Vicinamibacterales bacterium]
MAPRRVESRPLGAAAVWIMSALLAGGCATTSAYHEGERAERTQEYDRAVVEYTKALREHPDDKTARLALDRSRLRAAEQHFFRGRRLVGIERYEDGLLEFQVASELNPTSGDIEAALRDARLKVRAKLAVSREGKTELQSLIERTRTLAPPGLDLPGDVKLPDSLVFSNASSRMVFMALARFANLSVVFDPGFRDQPITVDLRKNSLEDALTSLTASTHTFYRVTAQRTVTIVPDTPAKRREYEESVVRTFYLSNADIKEVIDLLRVVVDVRQISPITATNAISLKDTPERIAAAAQLISAIDKARPEVVIDVELLEVDRTKLAEYGMQFASAGSNGINGSVQLPTNLTLESLTNLTQSDVVLAGFPSLYYRLLKSDVSTRVLANPHIRTSDGLAAQARFGEQVPVPSTTFAPLAAGGINTQPVTAYDYRNIGVNIDITPRTHHDDELSLALKISVTSQTGQGFAGLPTFGNREVNTTIRLKDGETNILAGLIRDDERTELSGTPGLSDLPLIGRLFAVHHKEATQSDIVLTLTPHIVRVLDLSENDLRPFRLSRDSGSSGTAELPSIQLPPRDRDEPLAPPPTAQPGLPYPQPLQGLPGTITPLPGTTTPPKKPGGGS